MVEFDCDMPYIDSNLEFDENYSNIYIKNKIFSN
jgi:hypothetical protein